MNAINAAGAGVTASINTSGGKNSLQIVAAGGPTTITLNDLPGASPVSLISHTNQGANATFTLNGTIAVTKSTNVINDVLPGLSITLKKPTTGSVSLSLATDSSQLSNALQTFTQDYNALVAQEVQQVGPSAQALGGDSLISQISDDLRQLSGYSASSGSIRSLSDLGVTFNDQTTGHLSFDPTVISGLSPTQVSDAFKFLGSSSSGFAAFANNFTQLSDPITGMIQVQENGYDTSNTQLGDQISILSARATLVTNALNAQLQQADALVAQLQSQQNTVNAEIQSIDFATYGKLVNASTGQ
jgi:flagellar hook-associated protein 2